MEPVNLAKRIEEDHPLRKLKLDFVREEVSGFYGVKGEVSVDPVVLMKMMIARSVYLAICLTIPGKNLNHTLISTMLLE